MPSSGLEGPDETEVPRRRTVDSIDSVIEAEVNKRVAAIVKDREIETSLRQINGHLKRLDARVDAANHLKAEMVTKEDFREFRTEFTREMDSRFKQVITKTELGDGDFIVETGLVVLDQHQRQLLTQGFSLMEEHIREQAEDAKKLAEAHVQEVARNRRIELRSFVISAAAGVVSAAVSVGIVLSGWLPLPRAH